MAQSSQVDSASPRDTSMTTADQVRGEPPLPLDRLDHLLSPLRRTLGWALREGRAEDQPVRYLEVNAGRFVRRALALDLPHAVRDALASLLGRLDGFDAAPRPEQAERLRAMNHLLARIDSVLGLPLEEVPRPRSTSREAAAPAPRKEREGARDKPGRATPPAQRRGPPTYRLGDDRHTGRPLAEFDVAPDVVEALAKRGVHTLADLLLLAPTGEQVLRPIHGAGRPLEPGRVAVGGRVHARRTRCLPDGTARTEILLHGAGPLWARWPRRAPAAVLEELQLDTRTVLVGTWGGDEPLEDPEVATDAGDRAVRLARYDVPGLPDRRVRTTVRSLLPHLDQLRDSLPRELRAQHDLIELPEALRQAHTVPGADPAARRRLAFGEAMACFLGASVDRYQGNPERGIAHPVVHGMAARLQRFQEVHLSDAQQRVFESIKRDLKRSRPMRRVLTGEVGVGQASVALLTTVVVAESKSQALVLASDAATAESRFLFAEPMLREIGLVVRLLEGGASRAQLDALRRGEVHVAFGTTDLLDSGLDFRRLGLVVAEEAGPLGAVDERIRQLDAPRPDLLAFTHQPVPTVGLFRAYSDQEISLLDGVIEGEVACTIQPATDRVDVYDRVAERVARGQQAWVMFPTVRGRDALDRREAMRVQATLEGQVFDGARVGLFHGSMSRDERHRTYDDFRHHRYDVVVATTWVEDGPPVPDACMAIVEQADKLDGGRVDRIRGHVARARHPGSVWFVLGDDPDPEGTVRLERLLEHPPFTPDLPELVESLQLTDEAWPAPRFAWLRPHLDRALSLAAHDVAHERLERDPGLRSGPHRELARAARWWWPRLFEGECPISPPRSGRRRRRRSS